MNAEMPSSVRAASATKLGPLAVGDPGLRAVDTYSSPSRAARQEMLRVSLPASGSDRESAPRRSPEASDGQPALLLFLVAVRHDQRGRHGVGVDDAGQAHPAVGQLLDDADVGQQVEAEAAVVLGDGDAEEPELAHLLDDLGREPVVVLQLGGDGSDLVGDEAADGLDDLPAHVGIGRACGGGGIAHLLGHAENTTYSQC